MVNCVLEIWRCATIRGRASQQIRRVRLSQAKSADSTGGPTPAAEGLRFGLTARHRGPKVAAFVTFLAVLAMVAGL